MTKFDCGDYLLISKEERDELLILLDFLSVEWHVSNGKGGVMCSYCLSMLDDGHLKDCELDRMVKLLESLKSA